MNYDNEDVLFNVRTIDDNLKRFKKFGKLEKAVAINVAGETARIGKIKRDDEDVTIIFYPDGEFDRFEPGESIRYREGWDGPDTSKQKAKPSLICNQCGADRFKEDCKGDRSRCDLYGVAQDDPEIAKKLSEAQRLRKNELARKRYAEKKAAQGSKSSYSHKKTLH